MKTFQNYIKENTDATLAKVRAYALADKIRKSGKRLWNGGLDTGRDLGKFSLEAIIEDYFLSE